MRNTNDHLIIEVINFRGMLQSVAKVSAKYAKPSELVPSPDQQFGV